MILYQFSAQMHLLCEAVLAIMVLLNAYVSMLTMDPCLHFS